MEIDLTTGSITTNDRNGDIAHEIGHACGLSHIENLGRLMFRTNERWRTYPSKEENDVIQ